MEDTLHRAPMSVQPLKNADTLACPGGPAMPTDPEILKALSATALVPAAAGSRAIPRHG